MAKPFSIMHISDLHRSPTDPITNAELVSALVSDRARYLHEDPKIAPPDAIVVSGDIIQGLPLNAPNHEAELAAQYVVAEEFLDELVKRFLAGDRSRLVMVPGNHDIDWNTAIQAMQQVDPKSLTGDIAKLLRKEGSQYRWDWKTLTLYRIQDTTLYEKRLDAYWNFFKRFYAGVPNLLKVNGGADANLFQLCDGRIGVAAFNSCHGNDCFAFHGMIRRDVVARSHLDLDDVGGTLDLRMAVWHHSIEGPPYRTDYMDIDIVRGMIGRGFRLGLYGHQHKAQVAPHQVWLPDQERMAVVSAGSLCAGASELPTGFCRQYNIIEIADDFRSARIHVRAMAVANLFSRGQLIDFGGNSFATLDWTPPRNAVGQPIDTTATRRRLAIEQAESAVRAGDWSQAIDILLDIATPAGTFERDLLFRAAYEAKRWDLLLARFDPPADIKELVHHVEACLQLKDTLAAKAALDQHAQTVKLPASTESDLRRRIQAQEAIKK